MATRRSALAFAFFAALGALFIFVRVAHAQFDFSTILPGEGTDLTITLAPQHPGPGQTVQLAVQSSYFDLTQSAVTWYANGSQIAEGEGVTTATVTTGALGSALDISVDVQAPDGSNATTQMTIVPTSIDLLYDSDSYVPPFYQGRALPSAGTNIRLQAIPHLEEGGATLSSAGLMYTWKEDDRVVANVSGKGKASAILPIPSFDQNTTVVVDAVSSDGTVSGEASITIPISKPLLMLYEDDPIFGVLYHEALGADTSVTQQQMAFQAVPYFAQIKSPNDPRLQWNWSVNGTNVSPTPTDPSEITINAKNSNGAAQISANVSEPSNIFMNAQGQWEVQLASDESSGVFQGSAPAAQTSIFGQ